MIENTVRRRPSTGGHSNLLCLVVPPVADEGCLLVVGGILLECGLRSEWTRLPYVGDARMATRAAGLDFVLSFLLPPAPLCISPVRTSGCYF
jgi:hypothetical protein